jgi:hypothetical protein
VHPNHDEAITSGGEYLEWAKRRFPDAAPDAITIEATADIMGLRLDYCRPLLVDSVAAAFPNLTIIEAHPGWPWTDELLAMALHKGNVFIDLSGWAPKYFPATLVQYARTLLKDKVLFGTDWPLLTVVAVGKCVRLSRRRRGKNHAQERGAGVEARELKKTVSPSPCRWMSKRSTSPSRCAIKVDRRSGSTLARAGSAALAASSSGK